jgi:histone H3/H4
VGAVAKVMSKVWSSLSAEDKAVYQQQAAEERERVSKLVEQYKDAMPDHAMDNAGFAATKANALLLQLPAARIRKICKLDPEVKGLSKEALQLITKCAECMTVKLGMETRNVAQLQNRRTILPDDVAHVCANREPFLFLKEDIRDLQKQLITEKMDRKKEGKITTTTTSHTTTATKPLSDYFQRQT